MKYEYGTEHRHRYCLFYNKMIGEGVNGRRSEVTKQYLRGNPKCVLFSIPRFHKEPSGFSEMLHEMGLGNKTRERGVAPDS